MKSKLDNAFQLAGTFAAILCFIDCVVLPILAALAPFLGTKEIIHGVDEQVATIATIVLCSIAFFPSFLKHRDLRVAALLGAGLCFILFANLLGDSVAVMVHGAMCVVGSVCILRANWLSRRLATVAVTSSSSLQASPARHCCDHNHR